LSYLRLTPPEYRAIARLCRPLQLGDGFFPKFKSFLVAALFESVPELAHRLALFRPSQLRLLFDHLRGRHGQVECKLSREEFQALSEACQALASRHRFLHFYQDTLVRHLLGVRPGLADKVARMSPDQFWGLYERIRESRRQG
jgi:hypothetical protein